jgi:hypothetical protein
VCDCRLQGPDKGDTTERKGFSDQQDCTDKIARPLHINNNVIIIMALLHFVFYDWFEASSTKAEKEEASVVGPVTQAGCVGHSEPSFSPRLTWVARRCVSRRSKEG